MKNAQHVAPPIYYIWTEQRRCHDNSHLKSRAFGFFQAFRPTMEFGPLHMNGAMKVTRFMFSNLKPRSSAFFPLHRCATEQECDKIKTIFKFKGSRIFCFYYIIIHKPYLSSWFNTLFHWNPKGNFQSAYLKMLVRKHISYMKYLKHTPDFKSILEQRTSPMCLNICTSVCRKSSVAVILTFLYESFKNNRIPF